MLAREYIYGLRDKNEQGPTLTGKCGFIQALGLAKRRATQLNPEKIRIDELSYQPKKLYTVALLELLSKATAEEINTTLKNSGKSRS